jgi:hypothetical protein
MRSPWRLASWTPSSFSSRQPGTAPALLPIFVTFGGQRPSLSDSIGRSKMPVRKPQETDHHLFAFITYDCSTISIFQVSGASIAILVCVTFFNHDMENTP